MSTCTALNLWSRWGGGVNVCSAALMAAQLTNLRDKEKEASRECLHMKENSNFSRNECFGELHCRNIRIFFLPRFQYFPSSPSCSQ